MLDASSGLIIGRVMGSGKPPFAQGNAGAFPLLGVVEKKRVSSSWRRFGSGAKRSWSLHW
jgi:hypothetical protein